MRALRRGRVLAPLTALLLVVLTGVAAWRWSDVYALLAGAAPQVAAALPAALRPGGLFDGEEREPNDLPARANALPLPPGADGGPAGGVAEIRGHVGAKLSDSAGDVDLFRVEIPPTGARKVLVAEWRGERAGEGIRGLDVALALNRAQAPGDVGTTAPLVASANRGGPGAPRAARRRRRARRPLPRRPRAARGGDRAGGEADRPLRAHRPARRAAARAGAGAERRAGPGGVAPRAVPGVARARRSGTRSARARRSGATPPPTTPTSSRWRGGRGGRGAGARRRGARGRARARRAAVAPGRARTSRRRAQDRVRFEEAGSAAPGQPLVVRLGRPAARGRAGAAGAPRRRRGGGATSSSPSGAAPRRAQRRSRSSARSPRRAGRRAALEVAAAFAGELPGASTRDEVLRVARRDRRARRAGARARGRLLVRPRLAAPRRSGVRGRGRGGPPRRRARARRRHDGPVGRAGLRRTERGAGPVDRPLARTCGPSTPHGGSAAIAAGYASGLDLHLRLADHLAVQLHRDLELADAS